LVPLTRIAIQGSAEPARAGDGAAPAAAAVLTQSARLVWGAAAAAADGQEHGAPCVWLVERSWVHVAGAPLADAVSEAACCGNSAAAMPAVAACARAADTVAALVRAAADAGAVAVVVVEPTGSAGSAGGAGAAAPGSGGSRAGALRDRAAAAQAPLVTPDVFVPAVAVPARPMHASGGSADGGDATFVPVLPPVVWLAGSAAAALRATANATAGASLETAPLVQLAFLAATESEAAAGVPTRRAVAVVRLPDALSLEAVEAGGGGNGEGPNSDGAPPAKRARVEPPQLHGGAAPAAGPGVAAAPAQAHGGGDAAAVVAVAAARTIAARVTAALPAVVLQP
jgi:hypothetical protein